MRIARIASHRSQRAAAAAPAAPSSLLPALLVGAYYVVGLHVGSCAAAGCLLPTS
jgi:hypothetical protein